MAGPAAFREWNEAMFAKQGNLNRFTHWNPLVRWHARSRIETALTLLRCTQRDRLLDVGCGAGYLLSRLSAGDRVGVDLSREALRQCSQGFRPDEKAFLAQADCTQLPFASHSFNRIVCTEVLEHVPDPGSILREIGRVATPNAIIVLSVPNERNTRAVKGWIKRAGLSRFISGVEIDCEEEWHLQSFTPDSFRSLVLRHLDITRWVERPTSLFSIRLYAVCRPL